jgi:SAM-dependent methyltransferase
MACAIIPTVAAPGKIAAADRAAVLSRYPRPITVPCEFCGSTDAQLLTREERYGTSFATSICRRCSLIYLSERWPEAAYEAFYDHDYRSLDFGRVEPETMFARQLLAGARLVAMCSPYLPGAEGAVLDVGASVGGTSRAIQWARGCRVVGVDPSDDEASYARRRDVDVRTGTLATVEVEGPFDFVVVSGTIDHMVHPFQELRAIRGLMREGGYLYVSVSDFVELARWRAEPPTQIDHLYYFTSETLRSLIQQLGFQAVSWRADTAAEAALRHRDVRENAGPWLTIEGILRVVDEPVAATSPDWRAIADAFTAARAAHRGQALPRRLVNRLGRTIR